MGRDTVQPCQADRCREGSEAAQEWQSGSDRVRPVSGRTEDERQDLLLRLSWQFADSSAQLTFFVEAGSINGYAAEFFRHLQQSLIAFIPLGRRFVNHHDPLMREAKLN